MPTEPDHVGQVRQVGRVGQVGHVRRESLPYVSRRHFCAACAAAAPGLAFGASAYAARSDDAGGAGGDRALVAITLDLEMSRNFPTRETTHWDYEKGNLNEETKAYTVEACRRVKGHGGRLHCFVVGRVFEQENVDWLKGIAQEGHPIGNHTYDHVNVRATRPEEIQYRFERAPWLIEGKSPAEVIRENVRLTSVALERRVGVKPAGFRTPGGFSMGLTDRPDVRALLQGCGFDWISSMYPSHPHGEPGREPSADVLEAIVKAQRSAQPFVYPDGLVEIPMSPISDIGAFRSGRWKLESFLKAIRMGLAWAIENRAVFDFLAHPSCLYVTDPKFQAVEMICEMVHNAGERAAIVTLDAISQRVKQRG